MKEKLAIVCNTVWHITNFRMNLLKKIKIHYDIVAISPPGIQSEILNKFGIKFIPITMDRGGMNPFNDIKYIYKLYNVIKSVKPKICLFFTIKPNIYGSIVSRILGNYVINNVTGLGSAFAKPGILYIILLLLYKLSFRKSDFVFFQNKDDFKLFYKNDIIDLNRVSILPGSGVDIKWFSPICELKPSGKKKFIFLLCARLLWEKGIGDYVKAAEIVKRLGRNAQFNLLGFLGDNNPNAVSKEQVDEWVRHELISYLGSSDDIRNILYETDCVVLPSYYREGVPRVLLEASSMQIPLITTNSVGCREVVEDGITGFLCETNNSADLAKKMLATMDLTLSQRRKMGLKGREKMKKEFDENIVINKYLSVIKNITKN